MAGPVSARTKQLALVTAILASAIAAVDSTAVNVALPAISRDLGGGFAAQQWVSNSYLLTLSALILLAGSLTDKLGERRVFTAGVAGFGIGSALCAASPTIGVLIVARSLQGVSGALLTPAALAIIVWVFPKEERGGAIGSSTSTSISSGASAVVSAPTKKSAASIQRSPRTDWARSRPPSASTIAGISDAGSACARLPPMVPRLRICGCAMCGNAS